MTYALEKQFNGVAHIRTEPKLSITETKTKKTRQPTSKNPVDDPFHSIGSDDGWITPDNIKKIANPEGVDFKVTSNSETVSSTTTSIGCVTTDFAMQNVLLQMGLNLISVDGLLLKNVKNWILRCHGCNK